MRRLIQRAHEDRSEMLRHTLSVLGNAPRLPLARALAWHRCRKAKDELAALDDNTLRDIGISRYDAVMEARRRC
jgi:uncharacterized protein YjiS (DUF1127 family)